MNRKSSDNIQSLATCVLRVNTNGGSYIVCVYGCVVVKVDSCFGCRVVVVVVGLLVQWD